MRVVKCEVSEDTMLSILKKCRLKSYLKFPFVKTKKWRNAPNKKILCEDCILKCEDPITNLGRSESHQYIL